MTRLVNPTIVAAALLIGSSTAAWSANAGPGHQGMHHAFKNTLMSVPNLSQEQRQKIDDLFNTAKTQTEPLKAQIMAARKEIVTLWAADTIDKPAVTAKQGEIEGALGKVKTIWADFFMQLHDVLTSSQRAWLALHGPGMHEGPDFGMNGDCQCNQPKQ